MPREWDKIRIPFGQAGEDRTLDDLASRPPVLEVAENWTHERDGALSPRPGFQEARGRFWTSTINGLGSGGAYSGQGAASCPFNPRAIATVRAPSEIPLFLADGRAYHLSTGDTAGEWHDLGSFWSAAVQYQGYVHGAEPFAGDPVTAGAVQSGAKDLYMSYDPNWGFVVHGADGQRISQYLPTLSSGLVGEDVYYARLGNNPCAVYNTGLNELVLVQVSATDPHTFTETLLASNARATAGQFQEAVWDPTTSRLYVAYLTTTATQIQLLSVTTGLTVNASVVYTHGTNLGHIALGLVNTRLVVAGCENAGALDIITKVYSAAAPPVDQALNVTLVPAGAGAPRFPVVGPNATNATIAWNTLTDGTCEVATRSTTAATSASGKLFFGSTGSATTPGVQYTPRYAPFLRDGLCLMGLEVGTGLVQADTVYQRTWVLIDISNPQVDARYTKLVAQGLVLSSAPQWPSNVSVGRDGEAFITSNDFLSFFTLNSGVTQGETYALRPAVVSFTEQIPVAEANGAYLIGGSTTYHYDGVSLSEANFVHVPQLSAQNVAGGSLAAGTYACQAIWVWVDALGKKHRSAPSNLVNVTVAGGATANVNLTASCALLGRREYSIEFYMSVVNPPPSGVFPMYLVRASDGSFSTGNVQVTVGSVSTSFEQLYTGGGVLDNFPAPGSDGGLAATAGRVWAASGRTVAASKLLENGPPAWAEDLELTLPALGGRVTAMVPDGDNLLVFCERAIYRVGGRGPDDTLQGQSLEDPVHLSDLGCTGANAVARCPAGVVFQARDNQIYLMGGGFSRLSTAIDRGSVPLADARVAFVHHPRTDSIIVLQDVAESQGRHPVWNYRNGQWGRWRVLDPNEDPVHALSGCTVDGYLWMGITAAGPVTRVGRFDPAINEDQFPTPTPFVCSAETPWIRLDQERARGWARVGAISLFGQVLGTSNVAVYVHRDHVIQSSPELHTFTATPASPVTTWPADRFAPEIRLPRLKASSIKVLIEVTRVKLVEMELDVRRAGAGVSPPGQRVP